MQLFFDTGSADSYANRSQKIRVLTESWVDETIFCPNCGRSEIDKYPNNQPVADFYCSSCREQYELKSKSGNVGHKIVDGAYGTMIKRLQDSDNPNFFLLSYDLHKLAVKDFMVVPKHFFVPGIIEKRKPLSDTARRAGWVGCNILLGHIPQSGKIFYVQNGRVESKKKILADWQKTLFLRDEQEVTTKGWLLDTMLCIERIGKKDFTLDDMYAFEASLRKKHPQNGHVKDKIRQQLQVLRDNGYLEFTGRGNYRVK